MTESPYAKWSEENIVSELKYLLEYLAKERPVGPCMSKRIMDVLTDYLELMETVI